MFDSIALNIVISLVFIYLLYSLLVTTLNEIIANAFSLRAKTLEKAIKRMLTDNGMGSNTTLDTFYKLPLIRFLGESDTKKPSYLTSTSFSNALVHLCHEMANGGADAQQKLLNGIQAIKGVNPETGKYLETLYNEVGGDIALFQQSAEDWFNETMDRATGWYKKQAQKITLIVALGVAILFNVDSIGIVKNLSLNPKLATQVVQMADAYAKHQAEAKTTNSKAKTESKTAEGKVAGASGKAANTTVADSTAAIVSDTTKTASDAVAEKPSDTTTQTTPDAEAEAEQNIKKAYANAQKMVAANGDIANANSILGLGWDEKALHCIQLTQLIGWLVTAMAISLGAPFWFDLLNKVMQLRGSKKIDTPES